MSGGPLRSIRCESSFDDSRLWIQAITMTDESLHGRGALVATLAARLGIAQLVDRTLRCTGCVGGALRPQGPHARPRDLCGCEPFRSRDLLRAGSTASVLGHRVMAPSTFGNFPRSFTFSGTDREDPGPNYLTTREVPRSGADPILTCAVPEKARTRNLTSSLTKLPGTRNPEGGSAPALRCRSLR